MLVLFLGPAERGGGRRGERLRGMRARPALLRGRAELPPATATVPADLAQTFRGGRGGSAGTPPPLRPDSLLLLGVQVPDQRVPFVNENNEFVQQKLLPPLLRLRLLPVCERKTKPNRR